MLVYYEKLKCGMIYYNVYGAMSICNILKNNIILQRFYIDVKDVLVPRFTEKLHDKLSV